jgi:2-oxoglutarate ferredoxin oxidoreductase subunit beta
MDKQATVTPKAESNLLGLTPEDYKGRPSTLCPGCGHNMVSTQIQAAVFELGLLPEKVVKISGIGCSSKSPNYFLQRSFGFNGLHGRMPTLVTGAAFADRSIKIIGISGDGDSASIGLGHFKHIVRRNVPMVYIIENNGVYGLTKGQFSATSDYGLELKHQGKNWLPPLDLCMEALISGATFVARSFAGDAKQLKELIKAAFVHNGISVIDVISPCVTFNNKDEALQSYNWGRQHEDPIQEIKFAYRKDIASLEDLEEGTVKEVNLPDDSVILLKKIKRDYDPTDQSAALDLLTESYKNKYFATGLIYINNDTPTVFEPYNVGDTPLNRTPNDLLRPSREVLDQINAALA